MKRRLTMIISVILVALLSIGAFVGCDCGGGGGGGGGNGGNGEKRDHLKIYVWGDNTELSWYEEVAEMYTAEYGFPVEVDKNTGEYYDTLNLRLNAKDGGPDLYFTQEGEIMTQLAADRVLNLQPYIEDGSLDVVTEANPDGAIELWELNDNYKYGEYLGDPNGDYYALIKDWSPDYVLWYNKDMVNEYNTKHAFKEGGYKINISSEVPMTWSEFEKMSYLLQKYCDCTYGTMLDRTPYTHLMEYIQMTGNSTFDENGAYLNTSAGVKKAFKYFLDLQKGANKSAPEIGQSATGSGEAFFNGTTATCWFGSWAYSTYNWTDAEFEIGIAPPPMPDGKTYTKNDRYGVTSGMISFAVNKNTTNPDKAIEFLNYYMTKGQEFFAEKGFNLSGNKKVASSDLYLNPTDAKLKEVNNFFYNFAGYTKSINFNTQITQSMVENVLGKHISSFLLKDYNDGAGIDTLLSDIAANIKNEVDS